MSDEKKWFIELGAQGVEQKVGPLSSREVAQKFKSGEVTATTKVWSSEMTEWVTFDRCVLFGQVDQILSQPATHQEPTAQPITAKTELRYAGFWIRFLANIIDNILVSCVLLMVITIIGILLKMRNVPSEQLVVVLQACNILISFMLSTLYFIFIQTALQGSPGKKICGLMLVSESSVGFEKMKMTQAMIRYLMLLVASLPLGLGLFAVGWHPKKQGWHDRVARTLVIYK